MFFQGRTSDPQTFCRVWNPRRITQRNPFTRHPPKPSLNRPPRAAAETEPGDLGGPGPPLNPNQPLKPRQQKCPAPLRTTLQFPQQVTEVFSCDIFSVNVTFGLNMLSVLKRLWNPVEIQQQAAGTLRTKERFLLPFDFLSTTEL